MMAATARAIKNAFTLRDGSLSSVPITATIRVIPVNRISIAIVFENQDLRAIANAEPATVIPANEAAAHIGEYATVEGVVARVFTSKNGNTFLNIGTAYPNQTFTGWIPNSSPVKDYCARRHRRKTC
jgi:hypothetical protein